MFKLSEKLIEIRGSLEAPYFGERAKPDADTKEVLYSGERVDRTNSLV
jgi:hypothetical protein